MTNLDPNLLKRDKKLIILEQAMNYCRSNAVDHIKNNQLKKMCNDRILELDLGGGYGGIFDRHLDKLGDPEVPKEQRLLTIVRKKRPNGRTASCEIYPNIARIESFLSGQKISESLKEERIQTDVDPDLWRKVCMSLEIDRVAKMPPVSFKDKFFRRKDDLFFKQIAAEVLAMDDVDAWNVSSTHPADRQMRFSESALKIMFHMARVIAHDNLFPFTLIFEFNGPLDEEGVNARVDNPKSRERNIKHFIQWAKQFKNVVVADDERSAILEDKWPSRLLPLSIEYFQTMTRYYETLAASGNLTLVWDLR